MTGRERFLTALSNQRPDHLPCQVHNWMPNYLSDRLGGVSDLEAYRAVGMDPVLYREPQYIYTAKALANWQSKTTVLGTDAEGNTSWRTVVTTPEGELITEGQNNRYTMWLTRLPIQSERDFEIWDRYIPLPDAVDWSPVLAAQRELGEDGIVRGSFFDFGQGSPWQSFSGYLYHTDEAIMMAMDEPEWLDHVMETMLQKKLAVIEKAAPFAFDLVETGGGGGSCSVISPDMHRRFCLPYDTRQHAAIHAAGSKVVHHLCGRLMPLLDMVVENGADALETMTPASMGADCDLAAADARVGDKLCFIGGFDQNAGFENGTPEAVRGMVQELFQAKRHGGFIISPSDHFFFGDPENLRAFVQAAKECVY